MSEDAPEGPRRVTTLLLGGAAVALAAALLGLGPSSVARHPSLVWALLLLPALVFTSASRLTGPSVALALGIVGVGLLGLARPFSPEVRWWIGGGGSLLLAAVAAMSFHHSQAREAPARSPLAGTGPEVEGTEPDGALREPLLDIFLHKLVAAARRGEELTVVLFRLDDFDAFRKRHGDDVAQQMLSRTERSLRSAVRDSDVVGRYGAADFLTILLGEGRRGAYMFANRIQRKVSRLALEGDDGSIVDSGITVSAGLASFHDRIETPSDLVEEARRAVDGAPEQGGNRILVARDGSDE